MDHSVARPDVDREPIRLPGSPFWNVFKRFGRDEMIALAISLIGTIAASFFTTSVFLLAIVGPVIEKIGFFPAHLFEAYALYKATPLKDRETLATYLKRALKGGSLSLVEDVVMHDPLYVLFFLVLSLQSGVPVWLVSTVSFIAAVVAVAWAEVAITEGRYAYFRRSMHKAGFASTQYIEARFYIRDAEFQNGVVEKLKRAFNLRILDQLRYDDVYFRNDLPRFSGRAPVVRLRKRALHAEKEKWEHLPKMVATGNLQTVQVVYTRPQEELPERLDQFRFFCVAKEKFYLTVNESVMPKSPREIKNNAARRLLRSGAAYKSISFERTLLRDPTDKLLVTIDTGKDGCVVELKVYTDRAMLLAAMRYMMLEFPVTHTTFSKTELGLFE